MADLTSTTKFKADISELKAAMQQARRQVKLANSEFNKATAGMEDWSKRADGLSAKIKQLNTTLGAQKTQLSNLEKQYRLVSKEQGEDSKGAEELKVKINNQKAAIANTEKQLKSYEKELDDCKNETGKFADETDDLDKSLTNAGDGFTVFKGILSDLISNVIQWGITELKELATEVIETGSTFEKSMSNVQALSGATEEELQLLTDTAKEFGASTQFSASQAADALSYMALAGWDAQTSAEALGGVLNLAAASGMDLAAASDMVTDYMSAFNIEAKDSAYFADLLAYAQSNANTTVEGLGEAFRNCAANMNAAGQDIETTTSLLSMMANQGLKGSRAGTALTAVMRDMTSKMEDGAIAIGEANVAVMDADGNYRDLTDILKDVSKAVNGMGDAEKASALSATFTSDSIKGLNLILNAGVENAADFEEKLRACDGTASDMAKTMNDNLSGDLTALNSKIEGVKITIYESFAPAMREAVAEISDVIDAVDWQDVGKQIGDLAKKGVNFAKSVIENANGIKDVLKSVGTVLGTAFVVSKVLSFGSSIITLWKTFQTLKTVTDAATTSQLLLNAAQAATPIGLVTAAVAGLAAGLIYLASKTKDQTNAIEGLTEWEEKELQKVYDLKNSYKELKDARDDSVSSIKTEFEHYQDLASELDTLVDKNGEVKEADQDRANFIITTLNEALGTEIEMVDGVIENYKDEKKAIEDLMETKKAQAILNANEEAYTAAIENQKTVLDQYTTALGIYQQNKEELGKAESRYNEISKMTSAEYAKANDLMVSETTAAEMLAQEQQDLTNKMNGAREAIVQSKTAYKNAEQQYIEYQSTIKNYEGLSSAIISGDVEKIKTALTQTENDFITAETGTRESLEQQVSNMEKNYDDLKKAVESGSSIVTKEMVDEAAAMVKAAKAELDKLPSEASAAANNGANAFATTFGSNNNKAKVTTNANALRDTTNKGIAPNGDEEKAGENFVLGYVGGIQVKVPDAESAASGMGNTSTRALNSSIGAQSPSRITTTSGEYFGQGFINGMNNKTSSVWQTAWNLAKTAINALRAGQKEGSPSKLTYESGIYFVQGYINGIASQNSSLQKAVQNMVGVAFSELIKMSNYNFSTVAGNASTKFADAIAKKIEYNLNRIQYAQDKRLAVFDNNVKQYEKERDKIAKQLKAESENDIKALEASRDIKVKKIENKRDATVSKLQAQLDALGSGKETAEQRKALQRQIQNEKNNATKKIKAIKESTKKQIDEEKSALKKRTENNKKEYEKLINGEKKNKEAYITASEQMLNEYSKAMQEYQNKAQTLIDDTINGITDKYNERYDELIEKQNNLVEKLKSAGELFNISGAGVMTVNDLTEQTRQIKEYTSKLQQIKNKVSSELFDEIASFDMKEGNAYMSRLLAMSATELDAYNKAYTEKMQAAEDAGNVIYSADIKKVAADYEKEINKAFNELPKKLEELGNDIMKGFLDGLTENTDYMGERVQTFVSAMVDTFKDALKINSPSKVMEELGEFSGEGVVVGLKNTITSVKKAAADIAKAAATPLSDLKSNLDLGKSAINTPTTNGIPVARTNVVNNYNLVQNNTSPKSLSALETYQARRQQIAMIKAVT